ncbi:MAG: hypothetical protein ACI3ZT_01420 [Candidatus Cryptobacteroides sp.]
MNIFIYIAIGFIMSLGVFPVTFAVLPSMNSKMVLALLGLFALVLKYSSKRDAVVKRQFLIASLFAFCVSLVSLIALAYNSTSDLTYATYIVSMWVWCGSAYMICNLIKAFHKRLDFALISNYFIAVCVVQCILAFIMDLSPDVKSFVDSLLIEEKIIGTSEERLYGFGCGLDVAGTRFSAALIMIACLCLERDVIKDSKLIALYVVAFMIITVFGNMISRTTLIGLIISIVVFIYQSINISKKSGIREASRVWRYALGAIVVSIPIIVYYYNNDNLFRDNIQFAFEGFFSLVEKGRWETTSNNRLASMVVFPSDIKTWIIGDGFFNNPLTSDPYYNGPGIGTYYMSTDIGYLRFIYYFGIIGLLTFCVFMFVVASLCKEKYRNNKTFFNLLLLLNFIIWCKVSTDIFVLFSLFLCASIDNNEVSHFKAIETTININ